MSLNELEVLGSEKPIGLSKLDQDLANSSVGGGFEDGNKDDDKVKNVTVEIPAKDLKPAQTGIKAKDVIGIALDMLLSGEIGGDLGAIASSDSYIMDGHHRWAATYIIDPNAKLKVTIMDMPGEQLVTALNVITKGKLGIDVGNKEEGDIRSLNSHTLEPIIDSCIENGKPGNWPLTPEQVKQALSQVPGATNYTQGKDILLKNANLLPKNIMPNAPRRVDMPVIDQDKVDIAKTYLAKGSVDLKQPYSDKVATNISENIDDILTEWSYRIPKGYPTIVDGQFVDRDEVMILNQLLEEKGLAAIELPENTTQQSIPEAKTLKLSDKDIDKILSTKVIKSLPIAKQLLGSKNTLILYVTGITKAQRTPLLQSIAASIKGAKYVKQISTAGAVQAVTPNNIPYYIVLKPFVEEKTDTDLKEGMSVVLAYTPDLKPATPENVSKLIDKMIVTNKTVEGLSESTIKKINDYLVTLKKKIKVDKKLPKVVSNILNENVSQGASFKQFLKKNPDFYIERGQNKDELFTQIRMVASNLTKLPADKWCPGDVYFVRKGSESKIKAILAKVAGQQNKEAGLTMLNAMFSPVPNFTTKVDKSHYIVAVSLKQSSAQGGKLKSAFQQYEGTPTEYNMTSDEIKFSRPKLVAGIEAMRSALQKRIKAEKQTKFIFQPVDLKLIKDPKILLGKYGAYKTLTYIMNRIAKKSDQLDDAIVGLTAYGFGIVTKDNIPINPPFLKLIADAKGTATEPQYFEPGRTLMLVSLSGSPKPPQIQIIDGEKYGGLKMNLALTLIGSGDEGEETIRYEVNIRYNGGSQLTIELGTPVHLH